MIITILGSGGAYGIPVLACKCDVCTKGVESDKKNMRTRSSILVSSSGKNIVVDVGQDFRTQILREKIQKVDHVLITHSHMDHTASLLDLQMGKIILEAPKEVLEDIERKRTILESLKKRNPDITIRPFEPQKIGNIEIDTIKVMHEKDMANLDVPTFGFLLTENGHRIAYIPDYTEIIDIDKVKNLDILICDGTNLEEGLGHAGVEGSIKLYQKVKPKLMILTHINHSMPHEDLEKYVKKHGNIEIAYDSMKIEV